MEQNIKNTDYPHIDKPWMRWYAEKKYTPMVSDTNITDYLKTKNKGREQLIAETYYGKEITYYELFNKADAASRALTALGVQKGNNIFTLLPNIPESGELWLGASQIGAISDFADPRPDSMDLKANALKILELIKFEKADYIVALDICYTAMLKPIENELKEIGMKNIVVVSAKDSMNIRGMIDYLSDILKYNAIKNEKMRDKTAKRLRFYQALYKKIVAMSNDRKAFDEAIKNSPIEVIRYKDLINDSTYVHYDEIKNGSLVNYIGHTSGTSGARPKPIPLTNTNQIFATEQAFKVGVNVLESERVIHELPFFSPLGADNNYILDLASGANLIDVPEFEINEFGYLIKKHHPNVVMGTPSWINQIRNCSYLQDENLSDLKRVIYGGDMMQEDDEIKGNQWLKEHNSPAIIEKGHGMSEYCGGGTYAIGEYNLYNSMGIPFPDVIYGIVNPDIEDRLVPVREIDEEGFICGELVVSSEAVTPGILNGNVIVKKYILDGREYIRTRDIVKMNKDGIFFFESRKDRSFTRYDGYKIKPREIEKEIAKSKYVKYCIISQYFDYDKNGFMPIAHIVLNENEKISNTEEYEEIVKHIVYEQIVSNPIMSSRQIPAKFKFRDFLPMTKNSKVDYNRLIGDGLDGTEINVKVEETNLSVSEITIYASPESNSVKKLKK